MPVLSGVTFPTQAEALASPAAQMEVAVCPACTHVYNVAFDPLLIDYDADYDNSLHHSGIFQAYSHELVRRLASEYNLKGKHVVELGCGKGHFLVDLCRATGARGTGYDRSYAGEVTDPAVEFIADYLPFDRSGDFDFFVSRHVVEHLQDPHGFLSSLRRACDTRQVRGYVEVPDAIYDFDRSPWSLHYPHVSYFSATSLGRLALRSGFGILRLIRSFEGQYLAMELGVNVPTPDQDAFVGMGLRREREIVNTFRETYPQMVKGWRDRLDEVGYETCVLWGAGAKGLGFLSSVDPHRRMAAVVDVNPANPGQYLPVTGHRVISPTDLASMNISTVIITNPAYRKEIETSLAQLRVRADVISAH